MLLQQVLVPLVFYGTLSTVVWFFVFPIFFPPEAIRAIAAKMMLGVYVFFSWVSRVVATIVQYVFDFLAHIDRFFAPIESASWLQYIFKLKRRIIYSHMVC